MAVAQKVRRAPADLPTALGRQLASRAWRSLTPVNSMGVNSMGVNSMGVDSMGVDSMGVDSMGVHSMGCCLSACALELLPQIGVENPAAKQAPCVDQHLGRRRDDVTSPGFFGHNSLFDDLRHSFGRSG